MPRLGFCTNRSKLQVMCRHFRLVLHLRLSGAKLGAAQVMAPCFTALANAALAHGFGNPLVAAMAPSAAIATSAQQANFSSERNRSLQ